MGRADETFLHHLETGAFGPAMVLPKSLADGVVRKQKNIALGNALPREVGQTGGDELFADAQPAMGFGNGQMMQIAAPPIMPAQNRADNFIAADRHATQVRIAIQKRSDVFAAVRFVQAHAFRVLPKPPHAIVVGDGQGTNGVIPFS